MIFLEYVGSRALLSAKFGADRRQQNDKSCKTNTCRIFLFQGMAENSLKPVPEQVAEPENLRSRQATICP